jgi:cation:H+ antiporter
MITYILFVAGIILLIKGAGFLINGASSLAKKFGVPTLVIGLTIVAFGTSMPELIVNIISAIKETTEVAFGNIIGSNLSNILLILGIMAIVYSLKVERSTIWKEIPFAFLAVLVLFIVSNDFIIDKISVFSLARVDGLIMLCFFAIFLYYALELARRNKAHLESETIKIKTHKGHTIFFMIAAGLVGLFFGGKWTVEGAVYIAQQFGLSQFLISATIVAIGTSLPELVTSITAALKKEVGLAVGNIVGSNIFNIFWILGVTSIIAPVTIPDFINVDILFLVFVTFLLFLFMFIGKKHELQKWQGVVFVTLYVGYIVFLIVRG